MIADIRKYTFLVHHRDYESLLKSLYEAGVMHIVEKRKFDENNAINDDIELLGKYKIAIKHLSRLVKSDNIPEETANPDVVLSAYEASVKEIEENKSILEKLRSEASRVEPWGNFDDAESSYTLQVSTDGKIFKTIKTFTGKGINNACSC